MLLASLNCVVGDCAHAVVELFSLKSMSTGPTLLRRGVVLAGFYVFIHNIMGAGCYIDVEVRGNVLLVACIA